MLGSRWSGSPTTTLGARVDHGTKHYGSYARWTGYLYQMRRTKRAVPFLSFVLFLRRVHSVSQVQVASASAFLVRPSR